MKEKPPLGAACNRCGLCCQVQVCGAGSYILGLVENYGDRVAGPCPVLTQVGDGFDCGLMLRPKDHVKSTRGVTTLRNAIAVLIGAGAGCDEVGDEEPDSTAIPKLRKIQQDYVEKHGLEAIQRAARIVYSGE